MDRISVDFNAPKGVIKPLHAINNGHASHHAYIAAQIPYSRNHDASICYGYGGEHCVDVHAIFPNFDADENDSASYDFDLTDDYVSSFQNIGTEVFYRLGTKIEHWRKKYGSVPPKDFAKWARISEHIIRHYTEGWANGFNYKMTYWEIWNEPDLGPQTWGGTKEQFFDFFITALTHLKACFPHLKIGGPAMAMGRDWAAELFAMMHEKGIGLDFYSWHCYGTAPEKMMEKCQFFRNLLDQHGFTETENICNEWNFVINWSDRLTESTVAVINMPGAAFTASCMLACVHEPMDMLMYYDAQPGSFNGLFDYYTGRCLKGYYPFPMFNTLYRLGTSVEVSYEGDGIYAAAAKDENGNSALMLTVYGFEKDLGHKEIALSLSGGADAYEIFLLDENHDNVSVGIWHPGETISAENMSVILLKSL
ncbi:MAG: hypothetical protein IJC53_07990 [Clostridia bacterium]|nr:hypothetical protein [Clostridia bacterium]